MTDTIAEFPGIEEGFLTGSELGRRWARRLLLAKLSRLKKEASAPDGGSESEGAGPEGPEAYPLRWIDPHAGIDTLFGATGGAASVAIRVHDARLYPKVLFGGAVGAAEAYMAGLWSADDLTRALRFFLVHRPALDHLDSGVGVLMAPVRKLGRRLRANTRRGSARNIRAHYDLSNDFFRLFLDSRMMYSSAVFEDEGQGLEAASLAKLDRLCTKLELGPGDHLLEIGTGWGGLAVHAAGAYGCRVTTTTISREQHRAAVERVRAHGLEDRVEVLLSDYRDLDGTYSKLVSVEMIEAVGHEFLDTYLAICAARLEPGGRMAIQAITMADRLFEAYKSSVDFIQQYIFPGSALPSVGSLAASVSRATDLQIVHLEDIGVHYARTLRLWRERFFERLEEVREMGFSGRFVRMWEYYLSYCEAGFLERTIGDLQVILTKPDHRGVVPLGRLEPVPAVGDCVR